MNYVLFLSGVVAGGLMMLLALLAVAAVLLKYGPSGFASDESIRHADLK